MAVSLQSLRRLRGVYYDDLGRVGENSRRLYATGRQNLLSVRAREDINEIVVVLNARFARVILGPREHHARIDLQESRSLGEMARLLHARLSVRMRAGERHFVRTDELVEGKRRIARKLEVTVWSAGAEGGSV